MADQDPTDSEPEATVDGDQEFEHERVVSREVGVATLRRLADGVASGSVQLTGDEMGTVAVPEQFELEVEYEADDEEAELEIELEWPIVDGAAAPAELEAGAVDDEIKDAPVDEPSGDGAGSVDESTGDGAGSVDDGGVASGASKAEFELYQDRANEWRWRLVHNNGNIIADSGEGYSRKATARKGLESVMRNASGASVVEDVD